MSKYTTPSSVTTQGNVSLRCYHQVRPAKKLGAFSGFHRRIKRSGASVVRKAVVRATWLVVLESALNTSTLKLKVSYHVSVGLKALSSTTHWAVETRAPLYLGSG